MPGSGRHPWSLNRPATANCLQLADSPVSHWLGSFCSDGGCWAAFATLASDSWIHRLRRFGSLCFGRVLVAVIVVYSEQISTYI